MKNPDFGFVSHSLRKFLIHEGHFFTVLLRNTPSLFWCEEMLFLAWFSTHITIMRIEDNLGREGSMGLKSWDTQKAHLESLRNVHT